VLGFDPAVFGVNTISFANGNTTDRGFPTTGVTIAVVRNAGRPALPRAHSEISS
jgi:hypothetical protein